MKAAPALRRGLWCVSHALVITQKFMKIFKIDEITRRGKMLIKKTRKTLICKDLRAYAQMERFELSHRLPRSTPLAGDGKGA